MRLVDRPPVRAAGATLVLVLSLLVAGPAAALLLLGAGVLLLALLGCESRRTACWSVLLLAVGVEAAVLGSGRPLLVLLAPLVLLAAAVPSLLGAASGGAPRRPAPLPSATAGPVAAGAAVAALGVLAPFAAAGDVIGGLPRDSVYYFGVFQRGLAGAAPTWTDPDAPVYLRSVPPGAELLWAQLVRPLVGDTGVDALLAYAVLAVGAVVALGAAVGFVVADRMRSRWALLLVPALVGALLLGPLAVEVAFGHWPSLLCAAALLLALPLVRDSHGPWTPAALAAGVVALSASTWTLLAPPAGLTLCLAAALAAGPGRAARAAAFLRTAAGAAVGLALSLPVVLGLLSVRSADEVAGGVGQGLGMPHPLLAVALALVVLRAARTGSGREAAGGLLLAAPVVLAAAALYVLGARAGGSTLYYEGRLLTVAAVLVAALVVPAGVRASRSPTWMPGWVVTGVVVLSLTGWWMPRGNPGYVPVAAGQHSFAAGLLPGQQAAPTALVNVTHGDALVSAVAAARPGGQQLAWGTASRSLAEPLYSNLWLAGLRGTWTGRWETVLASLGEDPWGSPAGPARVAEVLTAFGYVGCVDVVVVEPQARLVLAQALPPDGCRP